MSPRLPILDRRRSGVLLHPTALPTESGRVGLGAAARSFVDWLAAAGFGVWQVLPLGPVGAERSPYWVRSDQAGNPALIDPFEAPDPTAAAERADYHAFCERAAAWLEDYALYAAMSQFRGASAWWDWPVPLRERQPQALAAARAALAGPIEGVRVAQWQFERQWSALRRYAQERGVRLFGDLPIYVAPESVCTWAQRSQFKLDAAGRPAALAGVPPDYFSADGQLWGNPLYQWDQAQADGFAFWRERVAAALQRYDLVRIDHFRGLAGYWSVPAGAATAREGQWLSAPGNALLTALRASCPDLPVVAEDLGVITPDVEALRRQFGLPGMRVLQFGFDGASDNPHRSYNFTRDAVAYTGTHDNDTTLGWYRSLDSALAQRVDAYVGAGTGPPEQMPRALIRVLLASVAQLAIVPLQDLLALGSEARFNTPGTVLGNWTWRCPSGALTLEQATLWRAMNETYGRLNG